MIVGKHMSEETQKNEELHTNEGQAAGKGKRRKKVKKEKKKKRVSFSTILLVLILLIGLGVLSYPTVSDWWNSMHATQAIAGYVSEVENMTKEDKEAILEEARKYNKSLANGVNFNVQGEEYERYAKILDITGTGIMGYVQIASIGVNLPVYHGTDESVLQIAVGHVAGSSFPVGGERTHSVLSGHRGLPSAKLFSDLDKLEEGDTFTVTVLDQTNTYMIDQIRIVLPEETDELAIVDKKDYTTLVTCTPYGINTHRMLVRAHRIEGLEAVATPNEAIRIPIYIVVPAVGIPILFIVLLIMLIYYRRKGPVKSTQELLEQIKNSQSNQEGAPGSPMEDSSPDTDNPDRTEQADNPDGAGTTEDPGGNDNQDKSDSPN
jgi:sortase A